MMRALSREACACSTAALAALSAALTGCCLTDVCSVHPDSTDWADVFMIGGIAVSSWCNPYLGMVALVGVLLTSYMGTQAQAVGAPRLYSGLLGRADRVILTFIFPIIQFVSLYVANGDFASFHFELFNCSFDICWLEIMMLWFAVVGNITAVQRAIITWNNMGKV